MKKNTGKSLDDALEAFSERFDKERFDKELLDSKDNLTKNILTQSYSDLVTLLNGFQSLDNRVDQLNFNKAEQGKYHNDFSGHIKNLNAEIEKYQNNSTYRPSEGYVSNFQRKLKNLQKKFDLQEREINSSIFLNQGKGSKENYINNLKNLYRTFDALSNQIDASSEPIEKNKLAKQTLGVAKDNLLKELNKYETVAEDQLKNPTSNTTVINLDANSVQNLQLYVDEANVIISNLTESNTFNAKIGHLHAIHDLFKEMTEPTNGIKWDATFTETAKNTVTLPKQSQISPQKIDLNHELDRMLKTILEEQGKLLSLLVSNRVIQYGQDSNIFTLNKTAIEKIIKDRNLDIKDSTAVRAAHDKFIQLHQQEYKLRAIKQSPDQYLANKATKEKLDKSIQTLRKEIITLRQTASTIQKESDELEKKKLATGITGVFNRIVYGSDNTIDQKVTALEAKKNQIDATILDKTKQYEVQNAKKANFAKASNAIRNNSPAKLTSIIQDIEPTELYNKVMQQRETQKVQAPKKESWVKRLFRRSKNRDKGVSRTKN